MTPLLITIGPSHYCEKARWALERARIAYRESTHAPGLHLLRSLPGGSRRTPLLMADGRVLADSTEILAWVDKRTPVERRLFPDEDAVRERVIAWEGRFDRELGPEVRRLAQFHLLPVKETTLSVLTQGNPHAEAGEVRAGFPLVRRWMMRSLKVRAASAERAAMKVRVVFEAVSAGLGDGRRYLVGDRFSAADLTFGALSAPVLQPKNPDLVGLPAAFTAYVRELRALPAGRYGLRLLRDERG